jgi:hypothetical protein
MNGRCPSCGSPNPTPDGICAHHLANEVNWSVANRVFCDLLHRQIEPPPVTVDIEGFYDVFATVGSESSA